MLLCKNELLIAKSAPGGAAAIVLIAICLPSASLSSGQRTMEAQLRSKFSKASLSRLEVLGVVILLAASILLVFAVEEAGQRYSWKGAVIISTITLAGICWISFIGWEYSVDRSRSSFSPAPAQRSGLCGYDEHSILHRLFVRQHCCQYPPTSASCQRTIARPSRRSSPPLATNLTFCNCRARRPNLELQSTAFLLEADWSRVAACWCRFNGLAAD